MSSGLVPESSDMRRSSDWAGEARKHPAVAQLANQTVGVVDAGRYVAATGLTAVAKGLRTIDTQTGSE